ncbi:ABC transporter permease [Actinomadura syzygii]|uniref:ABC transporter permease subunit n=1 Tax=Actinomadura syzygii TaxID=1427538 RepID=A0A5D0TT82_9ACTN|nr:ABC transporter permease subunit [Actinomadura syzygii]TYC08914.1 ABC transporter permease subunit [Actinomadura syzygii]
MTRLLARTATYAALPLAVLAAWWYLTRGGESLYFPPPGQVFTRFRENWLFALVPEHVMPSLVRMFSGLLLSVVVGVALGVALGMSDLAHRATKPWLTLLRSTPGPVVVVTFLVLFGTGSVGKVLMIAFVSVFPVLLNTVDGVRAAEPVLLDVAASYRLSRRERVTRIVLPGALPQISVGVRTSVALAFIVMIVSEYFGGSDGVGYFTRDSASGFAIPDMWSGMLLLGLLGIAVNVLVAVAQRRALRWYAGARAAAKS